MKSICFVTDSNKFDPLIASLKKRGVNCGKKHVDENLLPFGTIIVDMDYPLEQSYQLLERLNINPSFSDKVIIVSITHRTQLVKLRSFALGCDDYISSSISADAVINKVKELHEPNKYLIRKSFSEKGEITVDASLTHVSENGCLIKSKLSFQRDDGAVAIDSQLLTDLHILPKCRPAISKSNPIARKSFITEVHFLALNEEDRKRVRLATQKWGIS